MPLEGLEVEYKVDFNKTYSWEAYRRINNDAINYELDEGRLVPFVFDTNHISDYFWYSSTNERFSTPLWELFHYAKKHELGELFDIDQKKAYVLFPDAQRQTVRCPDFSFVRSGRFIEAYDQYRSWLRGAPDIAIEIITPRHDPATIARKVMQYQQAGTRLIWVINREMLEVQVYHQHDVKPQILGINDFLDGEDVVPGFRLAIAKFSTYYCKRFYRKNGTTPAKVAWQFMTDEVSDTAWNFVYGKLQFKPNIDTTKPAFYEPKPSITYSVGHMYDVKWDKWKKNPNLNKDLNKKFLQIFRSLLKPGEMLYALEWHSHNYLFQPHERLRNTKVRLWVARYKRKRQKTWSSQQDWRIPIFMDGEYHIFLATDFSFGLFGHPWEETICVFGQPLLDALEENKPLLFDYPIRKNGFWLE
jgi:Uma2 family endonuclease